MPGVHQQWRTIGALNAVTGPVHYWEGYLVGRQQVSASYPQLDRASPAVDRLSVIQDNWNMHTQPDGLTALDRYPRIKPVWLPTSAPGLNPIEKLWRWLRQDVLKMHRWVEDWGLWSSNACTISWISLPRVLQTCCGTWAWWARGNSPR